MEWAEPCFKPYEDDSTPVQTVEVAESAADAAKAVAKLQLLTNQRTGGGQRLQPVFCIVCHASMALCRSIRRRVTGLGGYGGNAQQASAADAATAAIAHKRGQKTIFHEN